MNQVIYILELVGDISCTPGSVTLEIGGVSTDKKTLERLMVEKEKELDDDNESEDDDDEDFCWNGYDLSGRPEWMITEHKTV